MKKIIPVLIIGIMVLSGLGASAIPNPIQTSIKKTETISFAHPEIQDNDEYTLVTIKNANAWLYKTDAPMLPASVTTYIFPFGTKIRIVDVIFSEPEEYTLENKITVYPNQSLSSTEHKYPLLKKNKTSDQFILKHYMITILEQAFLVRIMLFT